MSQSEQPVTWTCDLCGHPGTGRPDSTVCPECMRALVEDSVVEKLKRLPLSAFRQPMLLKDGFTISMASEETKAMMAEVFGKGNMPSPPMKFRPFQGVDWSGGKDTQETVTVEVRDVHITHSRQVIDGETFYVVVAVDADPNRGLKLLGSVQYRKMPHEQWSGEMRQLFVDPEYRRHGIGRALVQECLRIARTNGQKWLKAAFEQRNRTAMLFYCRCDFQMPTRIDDVQADGSGRIVIQLPVPTETVKRS